MNLKFFKPILEEVMFIYLFFIWNYSYEESLNKYNKKMSFNNFDPDKIKIVNLLPMGRSSSIFFQGLLGNHPQVITILGNFYPRDIDKNSSIDEIIYSLYDQIKVMVKHYNTTYDLEKNFSKSLFRKYVKDYTDNFGLNKKSLFIGAHYAFAKKYGKDMSKIKYILAHSHGANLFFKIAKDFPQQKVIFTTRDPRANYLSFKKINMLSYGVLYQFESFLLYKRLLKKGLSLLAIRHEDLHLDYPKVKNKIFQFLKINSSNKIDECVFFNLPYDGSQSKISSSQKMQSTRPDKMFVNENWKKELTTAEIKKIQFVFKDMMHFFDYKKINNFDYVKLKVLGTDFEDLSIDKIEERKGMKKRIFIILRNIYFIPIIGNFLIKLLIATLNISHFISIIFKVRFKRIILR